jgi:hypothetical protein
MLLLPLDPVLLADLDLLLLPLDPALFDLELLLLPLAPAMLADLDLLLLPLNLLPTSPDLLPAILTGHCLTLSYSESESTLPCRMMPELSPYIVKQGPHCSVRLLYVCGELYTGNMGATLASTPDGWLAGQLANVCWSSYLANDRLKIFN